MLKIGTVELKNAVVLAPMAGVTDAPFRKIIKQFNPGLLSGEMVSSTALHYSSNRTHQLIEIDPEEHPVSLQIFGSDPEIMAEAAGIIEAQGADILDINMGCPVLKVVKNGEGAALLKDLKLASKLIKAVVERVKIPVTVKCRLGWDSDNLVAPTLARIAEDNGAAAITVHGRTREQFYLGKADWEQIAHVKQGVSIPVIGNGDVNSPQAAAAMLQQTGCDAVMIGQAVLGRPWIFEQVVRYLETGELQPDPELDVRFRIIKEHLRMQVAFSGETRGIKEMRKHLAWYFKGMPGAAAMRDLVYLLGTLAEVEAALTRYADSMGIATSY